MNLLSITYPKRSYAGSWGSSGIQLNRRDMLLLIWHLAWALVRGREWIQLDWYHRGKPGGHYRIAKPIHEMGPDMRYNKAMQ